VVTIAQLRAVLAILRVEADSAGEHARESEMGAERAMLVGLLHRLASSELRRVITDTASEDEIVRATEASTISMDGENPTEQARFDAHWLHDRIEVLAAHTVTDPAPVLLDAAGRAAEAAEVLLALSRNPRSGDAENRWRTALDDLAAAYHMINDKHIEQANTTTQPIGSPFLAR
jgi:hypothetical protein